MTVKDEQLLLHEHGFGHDGTRAGGTGEADDSGQQMQKQDGEIAHGRVPSLVEKQKWRNLLLTQTDRR